MSGLGERIRGFLPRSLLLTSEQARAERDALLRELRMQQTAQVPALARLTRVFPEAALPTDSFRTLRIAAHSKDDDVRVFRTSGTTQGRRGEHAFRDLSLYATAAELWAQCQLFEPLVGDSKVPLFMFAPSPDELSDSSLSYMLGVFSDRFALRTTWCIRDGRIDLEELRSASKTGPVGVLGTSLGLMFAMEEASERCPLAEGSFLMQTGGFKGRVHSVSASELESQLSAYFAVPRDRIVQEYGMTELSSQAYQNRTVGSESFRFPPWVRISVVQDASEWGDEREGATGVLRVDDLANVDSCASILTGDVARVTSEGFQLLGRASSEVLRGCSLTAEEVLRSGESSS